MMKLRVYKRESVKGMQDYEMKLYEVEEFFSVVIDADAVTFRAAGPGAGYPAILCWTEACGRGNVVPVLPDMYEYRIEK